MADASAPSPGAPREVLADLGHLTRKVRAAQRGTWFPLLMFGLVTLGGILVDRVTFSIRTIPCPAAQPPGSGPGCVLTRQGSSIYWATGFLLAYAVTAFFYVRRSRSRGVGTPVRPYIIAGIGIAAVFAITSIWASPPPTPTGNTIDFWGLHLNAASGWTILFERFTGEAVHVGVPLLVLAWVERSRALFVFTLAFLAIELAPITAGWTVIASTSPWSGMPGLAVPGGFLLLGALGFALAQRSRGHGAA